MKLMLGVGAVLAIVLVLALILYVILIWENRGSERVLGAALPIILGAISSIGAGLALTVLSLGEPAIVASFETLFIYNKSDKMPFQPAVANLPAYAWEPWYIRFSADTMRKDPSNALQDGSDPLGQDVYHHLLQRAIIEWISEHYGDSWDVEIVEFGRHVGAGGWHGPKPGSTESKRIYTGQEIAKELGPNRFGNIQPPRPIAVPPGTKIIIHAPPPHGPGEIILKNRFCSITIHTRPAQTGVGVPEHYIRFYGISRTEAAKYANSLFHVTATSEFTKYLAGNPNTQKYKEWAQQMTKGLEAEFDEQRIWSGARDEYLFWK